MTQRSNSITIRDVARKAGVSVATVSRYFNSKGTVSSEVSRRVQLATDELGYFPRMVARHLATRRTFTVGLLSNTIQYSFFGPLVGGLESVLRAEGYSLYISTFVLNSYQITPPVGPHNTDGVIVFSNTLDEKMLGDWYNQEFPVVLAHHTAPAACPVPYVTVENRTAVRKLTDHLIEVHGKRKIAFMSAPEKDEDGALREAGYRESLEAHRIAVDPRIIFSADYEREYARQAIREKLEANRAPIDAIVASDDDIAFSVVGALNDSGLEVPEDVAVTGFDDQRFASLFFPPLTTVRSPTGMVGRTAGEQMLKLLQGLPADPVTVFPTELVIRQSCGCQI